MSTYATIADLIAAIPRGEQELIELTDRTGSGQYDQVRVLGVLQDASDMVNSYVAKVARLPLATIPRVLRVHTANIARYLLWGDAPSEEIRKRYEQAIAWLKDLVAGRADLGVPAEEIPQLVSRARRGQVASWIDWDNYP